MKTLWEVWTNDLPGSFNKSETLEMLRENWNLSPNATYNKLKQGRFTVSDLCFFYSCFCIAFDYKRGFFFDTESYNSKRELEERRSAKGYGLARA